MLNQMSFHYVGERYGYHVNAWHNFDEYSHFTSAGVLIDTTPPKVGMGKHVLDLDSSMSEEVRFTTDTSGVYASWENVFSDAESGINFYIVSIGTSQEGNELFGPINMGLTTNVSFCDTQLIPGYKYYTTVTAYNTLGMVQTAYSSGFIVDIEKPFAGVVFTDFNFKNSRYKNQKSFKISWNGFTDRHSFIEEYSYTIEPDGTPIRNLEFESTYLQNEVVVYEKLEHNKPYRVYVKATDAAGHESDVVTSSPFIVDETAPMILKCDSHTEIVYEGMMNCQCEAIAAYYHDNKHCACSATSNITGEVGEMYKIKLSMVDHPGKVKAKLELGSNTEWVYFNRLSWSQSAHMGFFIPTISEDINPILYLTSDINQNISLTVSKCKSSVGNSQIEQLNKHTIRITVPAFDLESGIKYCNVGFGTTPGGFQLLSLSTVTQQTFTTHLKVNHKSHVYGTVIVENKAGTSINETTGPLLVDWTPPAIFDLVTSSSIGSNGSVDLRAEWSIIEEESDVTDCLWAVGSSLDLDDITPQQVTTALTYSEVTLTNVSHGDVVHISVRCYNILNLYGTERSQLTVFKQPPDSGEALVRVYPQGRTAYRPQGESQVSQSVLEFTHHGFQDPAGISYYEFLFPGEMEWKNASKLDHFLTEEVGLQESDLNEVSVRAVNTHGFRGPAVHGSVLVYGGRPQLTGNGLEWTVSDDQLSITWSGVFSWDTQHGGLRYEVSLGTTEGSTDLLKTHQTVEEQVEVMSGKIEPPVTVYCVVTAVCPTGLYETYRENIHL